MQPDFFFFLIPTLLLSSFVMLEVTWLLCASDFLVIKLLIVHFISIVVGIKWDN